MEKTVVRHPNLKFKILWFSFEADGLHAIVAALTLMAMLLGFAWLTGLPWRGLTHLASAIAGGRLFFE